LINFNEFRPISTEFDERSAEGGTTNRRRRHDESPKTRHFEWDWFSKLCHFWKAASLLIAYNLLPIGRPWIGTTFWSPHQL